MINLIYSNLCRSKATCTDVTNVTTVTDLENTFTGSNDGSTANSNTTITVVSDELKVEKNSGNHIFGTSKNFTITQNGTDYMIDFDITLVSGLGTDVLCKIGSTTVATITSSGTHNNISLGNLSSGQYTITFVTNTSVGGSGKYFTIDNVNVYYEETTPIMADYKYGFNGMEKDNEVKGNGISLDFGARIYDSRLGRWLSIDPAIDEYPYLSGYNSYGNNPLIFVDPDGKRIRPFRSDRLNAKALIKILATRDGSQKIRTLIDAKGINGTFYVQEVFLTRNTNYDDAKNIISYATTSLWPHPMDGGVNRAEFRLGHEINHAEDDWYGRDLKTKKGVDLAERRAVYFENYLRDVYGYSSLRDKYFGRNLKFPNNPSAYNPNNEKVQNLQLYGNSSWTLEKNEYVESNFQRKVGDGEWQDIYLRVTMNKDGDINFQEYTNEKEFLKDRPSTSSTE